MGDLDDETRPDFSFFLGGKPPLWEAPEERRPFKGEKKDSLERRPFRARVSISGSVERTQDAMAAKETTPLSGEETTSAIEEAQKLYFGAFGLCACAGGAFAGVYSGTGNLGAAWGAASGLIFAAIGMVVYGYKLMSKAKEMTVAKDVVDEAKTTKAKPAKKKAQEEEGEDQSEDGTAVSDDGNANGAEENEEGEGEEGSPA